MSPSNPHFHAVDVLSSEQPLNAEEGAPFLNAAAVGVAGYQSARAHLAVLPGCKQNGTNMLQPASCAGSGVGVHQMALSTAPKPLIRDAIRGRNERTVVRMHAPPLDNGM